MPTRIAFTFYGDTELDRTLLGFELGAADASPAFEQIGDRFAEVERRQFDSEGAYGSAGWPALAPNYEQWKRRHYPGKTILRRTDELYNALTERPFGIDVVESDRAVFGAQVLSEDGFDYGWAHQQGQGVPVRKPIDLPESERREWVKIMQRWLVSNLDR